MTVKELRAQLDAGTMTAREVVDGYLQRIEEEDHNIGAFLDVYAADARMQADEIDRKRAAGEPLGPLAGVPVAIKDNMLIAGKRVSSGSHVLENYIAPYDATVIERLRKADAIILGNTNMDEFACGSSTENSALGVTKNPIDPTRVPGGSSGGSAAAVASGFCPISLGSDTGGSIRLPAAFCGLVGFKPSYGHVSRYGLMAYVSSFDQIGPFATTVGDAAEVYRVIGGFDERDRTSVEGEVAMPELGGFDVKGLKIGVPKQYSYQGLHEGIARRIEEARNAFVEAGAQIVELDLPILEAALASYYIMAFAEVSSNLNRYDGMQFGNHVVGDTIDEQTKKTRGLFGPEMKRRILLGTFVLSAGYVDAYYKKAVAAREALRKKMVEVFEEVDVIMGPTSPVLPWKIGQNMDDPLAAYLADIYTVTANMAGLPALSVPCGDVDGLPVGLQILGKAGDDARVLDIGYWYENNRDEGLGARD